MINKIGGFMDSSELGKLIILRMKEMFDNERNKDNQAYFYIKFLYKFFPNDKAMLKLGADTIGFWYEDSKYPSEPPRLSWGMPMDKARQYLKMEIK